MKVSVQLSVDVDIEAIYKMCKPKDKRKCKAEIISYVKYQIEQRASSDDGWDYPSDEIIAGHLIKSCLASWPDQQEPH